ncbi:19186_t:CDS:2 [Dentiscutata erythropus]|uniref:19186_t:CDS:1 n=1 Tax=Dentiscutata erythropus TaxID=1348616 RepID=A0A9N9HK42_9GLOM|nr:19186_t:CDS:2 [Dentiscutata erythropus]
MEGKIGLSGGMKDNKEILQTLAVLCLSMSRTFGPFLPGPSEIIKITNLKVDSDEDRSRIKRIKRGKKGININETLQEERMVVKWNDKLIDVKIENLPALNEEMIEKIKHAEEIARKIEYSDEVGTSDKGRNRGNNNAMITKKVNDRIVDLIGKQRPKMKNGMFSIISSNMNRWQCRNVRPIVPMNNVNWDCATLNSLKDINFIKRLYLDQLARCDCEHLESVVFGSHLEMRRLG